MTSTAGVPNLSRLRCSLFTNTGTLGPIRSECETSPNSVGAGAVMGASGTTSVSSNDLVLEAAGLPSSTFGLFVLGTEPAYSPIGNGYLCVGGTIVRQPVVASDTVGQARFAFDVAAPGGGQTILAASTLRFQHVYRDIAAGGSGFNASDALRVTFYP